MIMVIYLPNSAKATNDFIVYLNEYNDKLRSLCV